MDLKPCPFCGNDEIVIDKQTKGTGVRFRAVCPKCMGMVASGTFQTEKQAEDAWNKRAYEQTGFWVKLRKNYSKCSRCGATYNHPVDWTPDKYCSECGARLFLEV